LELILDRPSCDERTHRNHWLNRFLWRITQGTRQIPGMVPLEKTDILSPLSGVETSSIFALFPTNLINDILKLLSISEMTWHYINLGSKVYSGRLSVVITQFHLGALGGEQKGLFPTNRIAGKPPKNRSFPGCSFWI